MDYTDIFRQTGHILRHNRALWLTSFLALSLSLVSNLTVRLGGRWAMSRLLVNAAALDITLDNLMRRLTQPALLVAGLVLLVVWFLLIWVVMTIGEGGMIHAAARAQRGQPTSFTQALSAGSDLLGPFVAIDTIVFFPLFVLLLTIMLIGAAAMILGLILGIQSGEMVLLFLFLIVGGLIAFFLSLFIVPLTLATITFRNLAFRAAAMQKLGVRESIRHTWQLIRQKTGPIIAITALILGLGYLLGIVSFFITIPLSLMEGVPNFNAMSGPLGPELVLSPLTVVATLLSAVFTFGIQVLTTVVTSTFWTVAYAGLLSGGKPDPGAEKAV
jgi:hypothetical protein